MDGFFVMFVFPMVVGIPLGAVLGIIAWARIRALTERVELMQRELDRLAQRLPLEPQSPVPPVIAVEPVNVPAPVVPPAVILPHAAVAPDAPIVVELSPPVVPLSEMPADHVVEPTPEPESEPTPPLAVTPPPAEVVPPPAAVTGASPRPELGNFEAIFGKRWLTWCGVGLVFLSGVFLLKYAYDQDWIGQVITPPLRIAGLILAALAMLLTGLHLLRKDMTTLGHGLAGGGIAVAYLAVYGGFSPAVMLVPEPLFPGHWAFVLMALITAGGMTLAVRAQAMPLAVCAVLGGFATPVLIDTGGGSREALFTYVLLLDLGVLGAALFRSWRVLDVLAFVGTVVLYAGWQHSRESGAGAPWAMVAWLAVFHLVFLILPFVYHWRTRTVVTIERFALAVGNLAFSLGYAAVLLRAEHQLVLALICLGLAALYAAIGTMTRMRIAADARVGHGFILLGTMLLALGTFYLLPVEAVATAWAAESVVLLALGYRYLHRPTRMVAHLVLACAVLRLLVTQTPPADLTAGFIWNSWVLALLVAPLGLIALGCVHRRHGCTDDDRWWQVGCWWLAGAAGLLVGSGEILRHAAGHPQAWILLPQVALHGGWWMLGGIGFIAGAWRWSSPATARLALLPGLLAVVFGLSAYAVAWPGGWPVINPRFLLALSTLAGLVAWLRIVSRSAERLGDTAVLRPLLLVMTQLGAVLLATLETMSWFARPGVESTVVTATDLHLCLTVVWATLALIGVVTAAVARLRLIAVVSLIPLIAALLAGFLLYLRDGEPVTLVANARFLALILAVAVVGCLRLIFTGTRWLPALVQVLATAAVTCELMRWSYDHFPAETEDFYATWTVALAWAGSAMIAARRWQRGGEDASRWLAATLIFLASFVALATYLHDWRSWLPFLNLRALAPLAAIVGLVLTRRAFNRRQLPGITSRHAVFDWSAVVVGFIAGTCEAPLHYLGAIADPALASRVATFSITVVWVVMAAFALAIGFYRRQVLVRYLALGLFTLTAAKLVLVDMSGVQQIYRIMSFMLVGVALIGASYAYHRLERRFLREDVTPADPKSD